MLAISEVVGSGRPRAARREMARARRAAASPRGHRQRLRAHASTTSPTPTPTARIAARRAQPRRAYRRGSRKHTLMDLDAWPYPRQAAGAAGRDRARALQRRDLPWLHPRLPVLPGRDDHPPGARALASRRSATMVENGIRKTGFEEVGLLSLSSADHTEIGEVAKGLADRYEGSNVSLSLPSTRVDAFNITLANEFSRNGRRSGLTFAPEGGSRADAQGDQQDGHRGGPDPHRRRGVLPRLAPGEALLHVRAAHRDRRGRPADRRPGQAGDRQGPRGHRPQRHPLHGVHRRVRAQAAHPVPVGRAARRTRPPTTG